MRLKKNLHQSIINTSLKDIGSNNSNAFYFITSKSTASRFTD